MNLPLFSKKKSNDGLPNDPSKRVLEHPYHKYEYVGDHWYREKLPSGDYYYYYHMAEMGFNAQRAKTFGDVMGILNEGDWKFEKIDNIGGLPIVTLKRYPIESFAISDRYNVSLSKFDFLTNSPTDTDWFIHEREPSSFLGTRIPEEARKHKHKWEEWSSDSWPIKFCPECGVLIIYDKGHESFTRYCAPSLKEFILARKELALRWHLIDYCETSFPGRDGGNDKGEDKGTNFSIHDISYAIKGNTPHYILYSSYKRP